MRLADTIIQVASTPAGHPMDSDWRVWSEKVRKATCYEIDTAVGAMAHGMLITEPLRASIATRQSRAVPHPLTWIEWLGPSASMGPKAHLKPGVGKAVPLRTGVLIESIECGKAGVISWMYTMTGGELEPTPLSMVFDWRDQPETLMDMQRMAAALSGEVWRDRLVRAYDRIGKPMSEEAFGEENRWSTVPCPLLMSFWTHMATMALADPAAAQRVVTAALDDLKGEPMFVMALIACMCTNGLLDVAEPADMTRLNAARRKRGRPDLLSFRQVRTSERNVIHLSDRAGPPLAAMHSVHAA